MLVMCAYVFLIKTCALTQLADAMLGFLCYACVLGMKCFSMLIFGYFAGGGKERKERC